MFAKKVNQSSKLNVVRAAFSEVCAHVVAANLYPLGILKPKNTGRVHSEYAKNLCPVLLVHGIIHNRSAFISLERHLNRLNWENIFTINYDTFHGSIFHMASELHRKVEEILQATGASQVDIIAHSLGGIVSRTYMTVGEGRGKVRKLVTLGTPHQGTQMSFAAKGLSRGALDRDLRVDSYLLRQIAKLDLPENSELISIYAAFDWTVIPTRNAEAQGTPASKIKNVRLENLGHMGLLYSQEAFDTIVHSLMS